jgi:hypothetical protein
VSGYHGTVYRHRYGQYDAQHDDLRVGLREWREQLQSESQLHVQ